jgi:hypothetical protein
MMVVDVEEKTHREHIAGVVLCVLVGQAAEGLSLREVIAGTAITGCEAWPLSKQGSSYTATCRAESSPEAQPLTQGQGSTATCRVSYPAGGAHAISAAYNGDPNFLASTSPSETLTTTGRVALDSSRITVQHGQGTATLTCAARAKCEGRLTVSATSTSGKAKKKRTTTCMIATAAFSIAPGRTVAVKLTLTATGRWLLRAAHGHLDVTLATLESVPASVATRSYSVQLAQQTATRAEKAHGQMRRRSHRGVLPV